MTRERTEAEIMEALDRWLKRIPNPDDMMYAIPGGAKISFAQALREVKAHTEFGKKWLAQLKDMADRHSIDIIEFIDSIT